MTRLKIALEIFALVTVTLIYVSAAQWAIEVLLKRDKIDYCRKAEVSE